MLGWSSAAAALASLISRCRAGSLPAERSGSILMATLRASVVSSARKTSPIPPEPSFRMIR